MPDFEISVGFDPAHIAEAEERVARALDALAPLSGCGPRLAEQLVARRARVTGALPRPGILEAIVARGMGGERKA